ncbi:MAG: HAMP domain-containing sensor histidine kinase [Microbacterium arborescens]
MPRRRGLSLRVTLTLSYAGFLLLAGAALFAAGLLVLRYVPTGDLVSREGNWAPGYDALLDVFVKYSWWAFAALVVVGLGGGWLLSGWMLAPVGRIAAVVRRADAGTLHRRIALPGPRNELTDLADAFDGMLDRIERTVAEEGRFAANASHELRTPHAVIRTIVEVAQADPTGRDIDTVLARIAATNDRAITTTEALLSLARAGRSGLDLRDVELDVLARDVTAEFGDPGDDSATEPHLVVEPGAVTARGDAALLRQLLRNLIANARTYNLPAGGEVVVRTSATPGGAALIEVSNTGPRVDPVLAGTLTEPFVRAAGRTRSADDRGVGLGLTIVATIVRSHRGELEIVAPETGGLHVRVSLPRASGPGR